MSAFDKIPLLPSWRVTSTESLPCPWCGSDDTVDYETANLEKMECRDCHRLFHTELVGDDLWTVGIRSDADAKYMAAMNITEDMVKAYYFAKARENNDGGGSPGFTYEGNDGGGSL